MSEAHGVNPMLVRALIQVESGYRPTARSPKGAMGLMQLMPSTAREYKRPEPVRAEGEHRGRHQAPQVADRSVRRRELALAAYNAGEGAVKKFNGIPPYRETRNYVSRILSLAGLAVTDPDSVQSFVQPAAVRFLSNLRRPRRSRRLTLLYNSRVNRPIMSTQTRSCAEREELLR